jgi:sulfur transfer protein SufE/stress-induced morphogen
MISKRQLLLLVLTTVHWCVESFIVTKLNADRLSQPQQHVIQRRRFGTSSCFSTSEPIETEGSIATTNTNEISSLGLTPELEKIVTAFERIGDDKLRYKQLLYMANQLPPFDPTKQIPENKVPGCLSTVYIDGHAELVNDEYRIYFVGDSDGLLTKGLVSLLVRGLSGNTAKEIQNVNPTFINTAGIATSLTPGRNNGFLNMLAVMKRKAIEIETEAKLQQEQQQSSPSSTSADSTSNVVTINESISDRPMYDAILTALQALKPEVVELVDTSYQHAGHTGAKDSGRESHFELYIVADAFDGLNLIKRHKLVYMMLGNIMPQIHALNIKAKTPQEVQ